MKNAIFLDEHNCIYEKDMLNNVSDESVYKSTYDKAVSLIENYSDGNCVIDIPMCWSSVLISHIAAIARIDTNVKFKKVVSKYAGLNIKAKVTNKCFEDVKEVVQRAEKAIDTLVQNRLERIFK